MPHLTYEEHLANARKERSQTPFRGLLQTSRKHGAATDPQHPWRDDPAWREEDGWRQESARHLRGD